MTDQLNDPLAELFSRADLDLATIHAPAYADVHAQGRRRRVHTRAGLAGVAMAVAATAVGAPAGIGHLHSRATTPPAVTPGATTTPPAGTVWDYERLGVDCRRAGEPGAGILSSPTVTSGRTMPIEVQGTALPPDRWLLEADFVTPPGGSGPVNVLSMPDESVDRNGNRVDAQIQRTPTAWLASPADVRLTSTRLMLSAPDATVWSATSMAATRIWGSQFTDQSVAQKALRWLSVQPRCVLHYLTQWVSPQGDLVLQGPPQPDGRIPVKIFHGSGRWLLMIDTVVAPGGGSTLPTPLEALMGAAVAKASGTAGTRFVVPAALTVQSYPPPPPAGFLTADDLGGTWTTSDSSNDRTSRSSYSRLLPGCRSTPTTTVTGTMQSQLYRARPTGGDRPEAESTVNSNGGSALSEVVVTLTSNQAAAARRALASAATCPDFTATSRSDQPPLRRLAGSADGPFVVEGIQPTGLRPTYATVYTLAGNRLVLLDTMPGGPSSALLPPKSLEWLLTTARTAADRATT